MFFVGPSQQGIFNPVGSRGGSARTNGREWLTPRMGQQNGSNRAMGMTRLTAP